MSPSRHETVSSDIEAFVLAGGRSSRMGRDKALVELRGLNLIEHALGILRDAGFQPRIAGGRKDFASFAPVIEDGPSQAGCGPLSGICSALDQSAASFCLFLPIDMPLMPAGLVTFLTNRARLTQTTVTLASVGGFIQTFPAVIKKNAGSALRAALDSGERKCMKAFQMAAATGLEPMSVVPLELLLQSGLVPRSADLLTADWFLNINTPQDLEMAESLLPGRDQVS